MSGKVTIYTIANDLGLSPGTVSKIINNKGNVSAETRQMALEYIKKVGYVPSSSARMLKSKRTYTIGIIFSEDLNIGLEQSFFSSILQHFKDYAESKGYDLSFIVRKIGQNEMSYYEWCLNKRVDGVYIVVGDYNDKELIELINSSLPCVSTDMIHDNLYTVVSDNRQGIEMLLNYISSDLKQSDVAYISGPLRSKAFKERLDIFEEQYEKFNLNCTDIIIAEGFGFTSGYNAASKIIESNKKPAVIIAASDDLALGVLKALNENGINVPNDTQVLGFDDIAFAKHFTPPLTTIRQDRQKLGQIAAKKLIMLIEDKNSIKEGIEKVPVELIERESTSRKWKYFIIENDFIIWYY